MYEQTFQFSSRPFNSVPRLEDFFAGLSYQQAIDVAHMCVDRSTGPVVVVGAVGMGKSLILQKIGQSFESRFDVVNIECSRLEERSELLQSILFELNLPYTSLTEGELRLSLMGYLKEGEGANDGVLLLVDEADRLSVELIDELRLITNQIRDGRSLVQLVLAGTQRLEDSLTDPKLASFSQRIAARCVLQNLSKQETQQFIYQHVERAGRAGHDIFDAEAVDEIYQNTDGCPRLINQLCDQSLLLAASRDKQPVDRPLIREAWAEMQNMPVASECAGSISLEGSNESGFVVEFGQLGDHDAVSKLDESHTDVGAEDPFAAQPANDSADFDEAGSEEESQEEAVAVFDEPEASYDEQDEDETEQDGDGYVAEDTAESDDAPPAGLGPSTVHATAAALAASAFAANAFNADPFAPQEDEQRVEDGNTESERIASLEQEQHELLEQTRGFSESDTDDQSDADEVRSAFEVLGLDDQDAKPSGVDDMIPADPFRLPDDAESNSDYSEETESSQQTEPAYETEDAGETAGASENAFEVPDSHRPMASSSIEEQLGLVEPAATEPESFHTRAFEPHPLVESESFQNQSAEPTQVEDADASAPVAESTDPFAESFEEEEMLQDAYSPFVAEQNQASLGVTSSQLSHLTPLDEVAGSDADANSDDWNSQTPELAIEELDETGVSTEALPSDLESISEGDFVSDYKLQASEELNPTHSLAAPTNAWQDNPETAWDPTQFQVPSEVASETPASFTPVPSVRTEIPSVANLTPEVTPVNSPSNEDPFAPQADQQAEQYSTEFSQTQTEQPVDADLEALTSDLGAASTFDLSGQHSDGNAPSDTVAPTAGHGNGLMDLNDLVPGHMLQQMEANNVEQNNFVQDAGTDTTGQPQSAEYSNDNFATPPPGGFPAPYSTHASFDDPVSPEAAAQAEARRKTEEFMRNFQAQREVESHVPEQAPAVQQTPVVQQAPVVQQTPAEQLTATEGSSDHQEEQSQEILKEIFSQQQILDKVHFTDSFSGAADQPAPSETNLDGINPQENTQPVEGHGADSVSIESPVTGYQNYQQPGQPPAVQDDRDMLYVNETQQYTPPEAPQPTHSPPFPNVETSTGNAERIDYNQLFEQLRNPSSET